MPTLNNTPDPNPKTPSFAVARACDAPPPVRTVAKYPFSPAYAVDLRRRDLSLVISRSVGVERVASSEITGIGRARIFRHRVRTGGDALSHARGGTAELRRMGLGSERGCEAYGMRSPLHAAPRPLAAVRTGRGPLDAQLLRIEPPLAIA